MFKLALVAIAAVAIISTIIDVVITLRGYLIQAIKDKKKLETQLAHALREKEHATSSAKTLDLQRAQIKTKLEVQQQEFDRSAQREAWCDTRLLELPISTPTNFHQNTLGYARLALSDRNARMYDLRSRSQFKSKGLWELYWCLAHASRTANASTRIKIENGISGDFLEALTEHAKNLSSMLDNGTPSLQMAYSKIYEQARPGLKEEDVGADILLVVAGDNLIQGGGARIFWIQAKKAPDGASPYTIDCSYENTAELQLNRLRRVHQPNLGSFGAYINYTPKLSFIPSFSLTTYNPIGDLKVNLGEKGARLPELVMAHSALKASSRTGSFSDAGAIVRFLQSVAENRPLYLVAATKHLDASRNPWDAQVLVNRISGHYRYALTRPTQNKNGPERDSPSPGRGGRF
ncbi:hypothetical protein [Herbaspirillum sp. 1130]|uniref:hypothetical protein n=1 Tax=Herbaspirillum sp. 1130 TaxID=2806562 RepID=UPI001AE97922|nr:hypothetical protein [Herbaspirillum sp. 1130]MBP1312800.1 hypothetical protein [Herbaspirillum sp. 1130]